MDISAKVEHLEVLVIDDDPDLASLVSRVLDHDPAQNYRARFASTVEEGLAAWDERPADVVLLDLGLPDAPRADPLAALRALLSRHPRPCIVVLTSHPWGLGRDAVRMGAEDYIDKADLTASTLRESLVYAVERHAARIRAGAGAAATTAHTPTRSSSYGAERLRGPLRLLTSSLEQLQSHDLDAEDRSVLLDQALRTAYAIGGQLDQVVAAQRRVDHREPIDLTRLAEDVVDDLEGLASALHATVAIERLPRIWAQREPMRLLLRNLLVNALQHTRPGVAVDVRAVDHPLGLRLVVEDDGPGIDAERRAELFDPRGVADDHALEASHQFGLRACQAVATAHGGRVWAEDRPGGGTRIIVELPVRRRSN